VAGRTTQSCTSRPEAVAPGNLEASAYPILRGRSRLHIAVQRRAARRCGRLPLGLEPQPSPQVRRGRQRRRAVRATGGRGEKGRLEFLYSKGRSDQWAGVE
jgi:hypothetical protein